VPDAGAEGVLVAFADFIGGFARWVDSDGYLHHTDQYLGIDTFTQSSATPGSTGDVTLTMLFQADQPRPGTGGDVTLLANGQVIGSGRIPRTVGLVFTSYAGMDIGRDNGGVVDLAYEDRAPYAFTGTIGKVTAGPR
jgi:arylsulfatase